MTRPAPEPKVKSDLALRTLSGVIMLAVAVTALWFGGWLFAGLVILAGLAMAPEWLRLTREQGFALKLAGLPYIALPVAGLLLLRGQPEIGFALTLWTFLVVWTTDIGAYFTGRTFGGPKLAPAISPGKTWSGLIGGMVASALVGGIFAAQADLPPLCLWLGAPFAALAQAGDLFESWLKRRAGLKDSGSILPGHGGMLDRLDGLVPVASVMGLLLWTAAL